MLPDLNSKFDIDNLLSILEVKQMYLKDMGERTAELTTDNLRFFCLGKELQDDLFLYSYDLKDDITIQCMKRAVIN